MMYNISKLRAASNVERFHTAQVLRRETVGHHSFGVANLLLMMTDGEASKELIVAALFHDLGEYDVGDLPSPVKKALPKEVQEDLNKREDRAVRLLHPYSHGSLTQEEARELKLADNLDGLLKCRDELLLGNRTVLPIGNRYLEYIQALTFDWEKHRQFVNECVALYLQEVP